jgi:hypothetical protein
MLLNYAATRMYMLPAGTVAMTPSGSSATTALYLAGTQLWAGQAGAAGAQLVSLLTLRVTSH